MSGDAGDDRARLAAIVEYSDDAILAKSVEGVIVAWNRGAERLYGYSSEEAIGQPISFLVPSDHAGEGHRIIERVLAGEHVEQFDTVREAKDGTRIPVSMTSSPIRDARGEIVGVSSIARNITERMRLEQQRAAYRAELERANAALKRSNAELEQFAYIASHDLQEPLRSIAGFVQLLARRYRGKLDQDADEFIGFTVEGVERMQMLINGLLAYSRARGGEPHRERVDTRELVELSLRSLVAAVRDSGAEVELGDLPALAADRRALLQVFENLLSNAVKFSGGRRPRIEVSAAREDGAWSFAVADNGIGIDPEYAERIFRMFQRLHGRGEYGGTGIGLAICQRIVERHGGRIWCEPRAGGGTVFRFTIPDTEEATA